MKRIVIVSMCFCFVLLLSGCQSNGEDNVAVDMLSTSNYSDITGRYFEETANGFRAVFLQRDEIVSERTANRIDSRLPGERYYEYVVSDPESWNMFIYYFPEDGLFGHYSFRFSVVDSTVRVYVVADGSSPAFLSDYMLILVQAPSRGARPTTSELYIDGNKIERQSWLSSSTN